MTIDVNVAYNRITSLIFQADGRWEWDDNNQTDLPIATTSLVSGQQDYSLNIGQLFIDRVEVLPNGGKYFYKLFPRDVEDPMWGSEVTGIDNVTVGTPMMYDPIGTSLFLYPIPNYSQVASLKIYFKRAQIDFTQSDLTTGTATPGFVSLFHDLIAYLVAYDYVIINQPNLAKGYQTIISKKESELTNFYAYRNKDDSPRLSTKTIAFR